MGRKAKLGVDSLSRFRYIVYIGKREKEMTKITYTDTMLNELKSMGIISYDMADEFATKHDISIRSVIAKVRSLELPYQPKVTADKPKVTKKAGESKAEVAAEIESMLNVNFKGLDKLVLEDLLKLRNAVKIAL